MTNHEEMIRIPKYYLDDFGLNVLTHSREFWFDRIKTLYEDVKLDKLVIKQFRYFTVSPAYITFYITDGELKKEAVVVKSKAYNPSILETLDFSRSTLLGLFEREGKLVIRYGTSEHPIFPNLEHIGY
jgi:hypothetical protein